MSIMIAAAQAPESPQTHDPNPGHADYVPSPVAQFPVKDELTAKPRRRDAEPVPCTKCSKLHPPGKSGLCRACFRKSDWPRRNAMAQHETGEQRKRDPAWQQNMITDLIRSMGRRAKDEDPDEGLARLLAVEAALKAVIRDVGEHVTARDGCALVAAGLGMTKQNAQQRWGRS
jgi:hypothetical protein